MKFTVAGLLEQLDSAELVEKKKLEKLFKLTKKAEKDSLDLALSALSKLGVIDIDSSGEVKRNVANTFLEARVRCSSKGYCFAVRDDGQDDIYIRDHDLNHAWHGDRVLVKITRDGIRRRSPEGAVQCILERTNTSIIGIAEQVDDELVATPLDERILSTISLENIDNSMFDEMEEANIVEVEIENYPIAQIPGKGRISRKLNINGDLESDIDLLISKTNLQRQETSPRAVLKHPKLKDRIDLTEQPTLLFKGWQSSLSPGLPAIHIEKHDANKKVWIHVPAIAERITFGSSLDIWIKRQSEAICLGKTWQPLINPNLTKAAEFSVGDPNEAVSICMELDETGKLTDWQFLLSIIKPVAQIDRKTLGIISKRRPSTKSIPISLKHIKDHISTVQDILSLAEQLREIEIAQGAIELDLPIPNLDSLSEIRFSEPQSITNHWSLPLIKQDPNSVLRFYLNLANKIWSIHSRQLGIQSVSINRVDFNNNMLNDIAKTAITLDVTAELDEDGSPSVQELIQAISTTKYKHVLEKQIKHALPDQLYFTTKPDNNNDLHKDKEIISNNKIDNFFISPWCCPNIYYSNILNQSLIVSMLHEGKRSASTRKKDKLNLGDKDSLSQVDWPVFTPSTSKCIAKLLSSQLISTMNLRKLKTNELRNDLISMAQSRAIEPIIGTVIDGTITGVQSYGFFVELPQTYAEGLVHVSSLNDDWYEYRARQNRLVGRKSRRTFQLGEAVTVKILKVDVLRNQIDLELSKESTLNVDNPNESNLSLDESEGINLPVNHQGQ